MVSCKNATNKSQKGYCVALKRDDRVLEQQQNKLIPKQRSNKPRYRRKCRRIWTQGCKVTRTPKFPREQLHKIAKAMHKLHLPFLAASERRADMSTEVLLSRLRWTIDDSWGSKSEYWRDAKYSLKQQFPSIEHASPRGPCWNHPPTCVAHLGILNSLIHFKKTCWRNPHLQIPSYWPVFDGVSWGPAHFLPPATTDSSDNKTPKRYSADPDRPTPFEGDSDAGDCEYVTCQGKNVLAVRLRGFWSFLSAIVPHRFGWLHQTRERTLRRNRRRHVGYLDLNQRSHNCDIWPQNTIEALLCCWERDNCSRELSWPSIFGRLIINVIATDMFPAQSQERLHWPAPFTQPGDVHVIDYTCRARKDVMAWQDDFSPLLFAAQHRGDDMGNAAKQLAVAFQPMMTLFVLYHLDCRRSMDEPLPSWMILYGAVYDEDGITIHAHTPYFSPPLASADIVPDWGWGSASSSIRHDYPSIVHKEPNARGAFFAMLNRIQGHCTYVLEKLQAWGGYRRAVSRILQT